MEQISSSTVGTIVIGEGCYGTSHPLAPLAPSHRITFSPRQYSSDPIIRLFTSIRAPSPSYGLSPIVLAALLFAAALATLLGAVVLARPLYALLRRQDVAGGPELTPLEQALAAVDAATRRQAGSAEHRESLAWLGRELRRTNLTELVGRARRLAWSEQAPTADASRQLTADVEAGRRNGA